MGDSVDLYITKVPVWTKLRVHIFSLFIGVWVLFKRFIRWAWDPNEFFSFRQRDNPPSCLVDSTLGRHSYVKLKGVKFHYLESGRKDKPLILLLHGFPDCWLSWRHQINSLSEHFHVVALDLKGFGDSDKPKSRKYYRIEILLDELCQIISALGVSSCILMGHDLGALIGWYFVHLYPEKIDKFICVSCTHPNLYWDNLSTQNTFNSSWLNFIQLPYLPEMEALKQDIQIINNYYKHLVQKDTKEYNLVLEAYKYSFSRQEDWTGPINYYRNLPFIRIMTNNIQITVPTLLVMGNQDQTIKLEGVVKSMDFIDKFVMKIVEGAGHFPHQENPEVFNTIVLNYLLARPTGPKTPERQPSRGFIDKMFGGVSNTVKYANSWVDAVQKKTNGVISLPVKALHLQNSS